MYCLTIKLKGSFIRVYIYGCSSNKCNNNEWRKDIVYLVTKSKHVGTSGDDRKKNVKLDSYAITRINTVCVFKINIEVSSSHWKKNELQWSLEEKIDSRADFIFTRSLPVLPVVESLQIHFW